ncbi:Zinc finger, RING-type [Sesbania bispinosa]|nr:Zinc finger, RING-type [Sesbania bispinosa]KAJ1415890.1 Zinc finger, RING-type [Sesbania bispinosa]
MVLGAIFLLYFVFELFYQLFIWLVPSCDGFKEEERRRIGAQMEEEQRIIRVQREEERRIARAQRERMEEEQRIARAQMEEERRIARAQMEEEQRIAGAQLTQQSYSSARASQTQTQREPNRSNIPRQRETTDHRSTPNTYPINMDLPPVKTFTLDCAICMEQFQIGDVIQPLGVCAHEFHRSCIRAWLDTTKTTCPLCREHVSISPSM